MSSGPGSGWLEQSFDRFPRIEDAFHDALDESLGPRGPDVLYDLVDGFGLKRGSRALDVGSGEGGHAIRLAERFGLDVTGIDPVPRHVELARDALAGVPELAVRFEEGSAEELPFADESFDLVWCRDVLVHIPDLGRVYAEIARVLRPGGRALVYQMFGTEKLEPRERDRLWTAMGIVPTSADPERTAAAIAPSGLRVDECVVIGSEWGERAEEETGKPGRRLLWAARLQRDPQRYIAQFGREAYDIMLGDCLWHVYAMIGKLERRAYTLTRP